MKIALPVKVSKTAVHLLGSRVPKRRSEPMVLPVKALPAPPSNCQATAKNSRSTRRSHRQIPKHRNGFPLLLDTNLKWKPGSFNPELCGGLLPSHTLARWHKPPPCLPRRPLLNNRAARILISLERGVRRTTMPRAPESANRGPAKRPHFLKEGL